jgi:nucleoside phosphorylase
MKICFIVAMQAEAQPFIDRFGVEEVKDFFAPLPCKLYRTALGENELDVVLNGQQHGSDLVGCEAASVATLAAIQQLHPDIVINSGTCGAFKKNGAAIGEVYVANAVMFHDRRVPGDDAWGTQALGNYPVYAGAAELANSLGYKMGKVTTGSSLDMQPCDLQIIEENHGELKDMEGAAVAFVCSLFQTPILLLKSVTDLCDSGAETFEVFKKNLAQASQAIADANERVVKYLLK